jgi:hypothetical protein
VKMLAEPRSPCAAKHASISIPTKRIVEPATALAKTKKPAWEAAVSAKKTHVALAMTGPPPPKVSALAKKVTEHAVEGTGRSVWIRSFPSSKSKAIKSTTTATAK